jgi:hypothetical protein
MTSELHQETLAVLSELRSLAPDVRLGQLFDFLGFLGEIHVGRKLADIEDDELLAVMYRHRAELLARIQGTPNQAPQPTSATISVSGSSTSPEAAPAAKA